jgi:hypothetical protein
MKRHFIISIASFTIPTVILWMLLPVRSIQGMLWFTSFLFFVVGDSVTTSLIRKYDDLEEVGPATRLVCGRNPSSVCAFGSRILFFSLSLLPYLAVTQVKIGAQFEIIMLLAIMLPLMLTVASFIILINNLYHIFAQEFGKQTTST